MLVDKSTLSRRWKNYLLNAHELAQREIHLTSKPVSVMVPTGQRCNLKCNMCIDRSNPDLLCDLSFSEFQRFVPFIGDATSVALYGWGEPLVNPAYDKILKHVLDRFPGIILHISTNGILLNTRWRKTLIGLTNCFLNVSVNAARRETYEKIMGCDFFDKVLNNVRLLSQAKRANHSRFPIIRLSFVMQAGNVNELPEFVQIAQELRANDVLVSELILLRSEHADLTASTRAIEDNRSDPPSKSRPQQS
jgi:MoaA/NifB/PqqE/SkfB family radical SAM enzyme